MRLLILSLLLLLAVLSPRDALAVEDPCIGESAGTPIAVCTDIEITEWRVHNSWDYDFGGPWQSFTWDCETRGGVVDHYAIVGGYCVGAADWTEANFVSMAQAIAVNRFPLTGGVTDTGFYSGDPPGLQYCDPKPKGGIVTRECRILRLQYVYPPAAPATTLFTGGRSREVRCPNGYVLIDTPIGARCKQVVCAPVCQDSAGAKHPSLANVQREPVFSKPGSLLNFDRIWTSQGAFNAGDGQIGPGPGTGKMNLGWSHTLNKRLEPAGTRIGVLASIQGPDGSVMFYGPDGKGIQKTSGVSDLLQEVADGSAVKWRLTKENGSVESFDVSGRLISIATRGAERIDITYAGGLISAVTDQSGRTLRFFHDPQGLMIRAELPDGQTLDYTNTLRGVVQTISRSDGSTKLFFYDDDLMLTAIEDEEGKYKSFSYSSAGQLRGMASGAYRTGDGYGNTVTRWREETDLSYNPTHKYTDETDARGKRIRRYFADIAGVRKPTSVHVSCTGCTTRTTTYTYDAAGQLKTIKDPENHLTVLGYDAKGRVSSRHELATVVSGVVTSYGRRTETDWHASLNVPLERRIYDADNTLTGRNAWTYNAAGLVLTESVVDPQTAATRTTAYAYCDATDAVAPNSTCPVVGLLKSVDGPRADVSDITLYRYHAAHDLSGCDTGGSCHRKGDLWQIVSPDGRNTTFARYDLAGRLTRMVDPNGVRTDFEYHARGWLTARKVRGANDATETDDAITRIEYDGAGQVTRMIEPDGALLAFTYDAAQRLVGVEDGFGNEVTYTLDRTGNRTVEQVKDAGGTVRHGLSRIFTLFGEVKTQSDASASPTNYVYDVGGEVDTVTDAHGRVTAQSHDPFGRLVESIANAAGSGDQRAVSGFEYDALDRLTAVIDPKGLTTAYEYDGLGDLVELESPDTGTTTYSYDSAGNRTGQLDARGVQVHYGYDAQNRLTHIDYPSAGQDIAFTYDVVPAACSGQEAFAAGRLSGFSDPSGQTGYCYDRHGNVVRKVQAVTGASSATVRYSHNAADRLESIIYPSGAWVIYHRDAGGRITSLSSRPVGSAAPVTLVSNVEYLPFGPVSRITFGNGRSQERVYDQNYWMAGITDSAPDGLSLGYLRDAVGNVDYIDEPVASDEFNGRSYQHDGLDRLYRVINIETTSERFTYDATGNRLSRQAGKSNDAYGYPSDSHLLTQTGSQARTYDDTGNTTNIGGYQTFTYDDRGRMVSASTSGVASRTYAHNARGERVVKRDASTPAGDTTFVYDEAGRLLGEYGPGGSVQEYVWLDDTLVAVLSNHSGSDHQYVLTDHLGTPRAVVHPGSNTVVWRWNLTGSAFGQHQANDNPDGDTVSYTFNLRYPGQYYDSETGLHYNYFRDYDPRTGRYVQSDPIGLAGGLTTYGYVSADPFGLSDPLGLAEWHVSNLFLANVPKTISLGWGSVRIPVPYGHDERATFTMHSECYEVTRGGLLGPGTTNSEMLVPGINLVDSTVGELAIPRAIVVDRMTLNDGQDGTPNVANLAGLGQVKFSVRNNIANGTVQLGNARGAFRDVAAPGVLDGDYLISSKVQFNAMSSVGKNCGCPAND